MSSLCAEQKNWDLNLSPSQKNGDQEWRQRAPWPRNLVNKLEQATDYVPNISRKTNNDVSTTVA